MPVLMKIFWWCVAHRKWLGIGLAVLAVLGALWWYGSSRYQAGEAHVQAKWDADVAYREKAFHALQAGYWNLQRQMQEKYSILRQEKADADARVADSQRRIDDLLRDRPKRPTNLSSPAPATAAGEAAPGCTGKQLFGEDGTVLKREAARADSIRTALALCQAQYQAAVDAYEAARAINNGETDDR
jgi:hypothetical protein